MNADTPFMAGSSADTPATPDFLRASDAERDQAIDNLRNEFALGRLSHDTFVIRMQTALGARNRNELARLFTDLPPRRPRLPERVRAAWRCLRGQEGASVPGRAGGAAGGANRAPAAPAAPAWGTVAVPPEFQPGQTYLRRVPPVPESLFFPPGSGIRFTIGRVPDCDLRLTDLSVSRTHAELTRGEAGWLLKDLGSHNGTRLNGWLIREAVEVRAGDRVEFGSAAFILRDGPPAAPAVTDGSPADLP
jgi:Domain of unknown function (DUF1707)/FHA domain